MTYKVNVISRVVVYCRLMENCHNIFEYEFEYEFFNFQPQLSQNQLLWT